MATTETRMRGETQASQHRSTLEVALAFAFGVVFMGVLLGLATIVKNPEPFAIQIYLTVLAVAAAGFGAVLPGLMEVKYKGYFRAGGSLALFALIYLNAPTIGFAVVRTVEPKGDPMKVTQRFLDALNSGDAGVSWEMLPPAARAQVNNNKASWDKLFNNVLRPLGKAESRAVVGEGATSNSAGLPPGLYKSFTFRSRFSNDSGFRSEIVLLRANEREEWEVYSYNVSLMTFN